MTYEGSLEEWIGKTSYPTLSALAVTMRLHAVAQRPSERLQTTPTP